MGTWIPAPRFHGDKLRGNDIRLAPTLGDHAGSLLKENNL